MSMDLSSFSPEVLGDPLDPGEPSDSPQTLAQALVSMPSATWREYLEEVFHDTSGITSIEDVWQFVVEEVGTVTDAEEPLEIWLDTDGFYTVEVY